MTTYVRRQLCLVDDTPSYRIRGEVVAATPEADVELRAKQLVGAPWEVLLPPCPDCGGSLVWAEAGNVPGTRACAGQAVGVDADGHPIHERSRGCGSLFAEETIS